MIKNKINITYQSIVVLACVFAFTAGAMGIARADKTNIGAMGHQLDPDVTVMLGKAEMINIGGDIADVLVANPSIVDVMAIKSNRLYVVGSSLGDTNIMALDANGDIIKKINIHVQMDTERLQGMISELYPNEPVEIRGLTDQLVLTGDVSNPSVANKIVNLVGRYAADAQGRSDTPDNIVVNMMGVRGEQQVMLRVKIVEASRNSLKDLGLETNSNGGGGIGDLGASFATSAALGLTNPTQLGIAALNYSSGDFGNLNFLARALEEEGIVNTLAEPNLTSISGEQAGFLAGGEFPIPTQLDENGNLVYEFRPFGVSLNFTPTVMSADRISLQLSTEVSTTSFDRNLQLNGINVPTFNVRRAETTVELPSGGTLMIAGLLQSDSISGLTQLPGIGDVPVVGDLVKSDTFNRDESEVVVMITPYLVKPFAQNRSAQSQSKSIPVDMHPTYSQDMEDMNYGALTLQEDGMPLEHLPKRDENKMPIFFSENLRRVYGQKTHSNLDLEGDQLGYIFN